jgi:RNA polymerase sigma-70 factor (ECF subfamily)
VSPLFRATGTPDFDRLYRDHAASVYRYAFAVLGNHPDAEDVTQQTFLNAYRAIAQGTKPRKAENWLVTIAHNEIRRHFRTNGKAVEVELDDRLAHPDAERSDPSLADILRALQKLTPMQRSALVMREFEGRSYTEIARALEITQSALETLLFRARRALAEQLEGSLTCSEAEQAVSRRLDGRLPRREGRRLRSHLQECAHCVRFVAAQKRQRALLKGLSVMPVPASLFLFRPEPAAAAGLGATGAAAAAGGSAALAGGSATGVGAIGIGAGFATKAAAVAAVAAVAGGVGYGVAGNVDRILPTERSAVRAAAVTPAGQRDRRPVGVAERREVRIESASAATKPARRKLKNVKTPSALAESRRAGAAKPKKDTVGELVKKETAAVKTRPTKPVTRASTKATRPEPRTRPDKPSKRPRPVKPTPAARRTYPTKPPRVVEPPPLAPPTDPAAAAAVKKQHG